MQDSNGELPLDDIQAVTLKPHGRDFVRCIFFSFVGTADKIRNWVAYLAKEEITSAAEQNRLAEVYRNAIDDSRRIVGGNICCFYLSFKGYLQLGVDRQQTPDDPVFQNGMKWRSSPTLNDPPTRDWQVEFQTRDLHAMILLAGDDEQQLIQKEDELLRSYQEKTGSEARYFTEIGARLFHRIEEKKVSIEPFGYRDGVGQIKFFEKNELLAKRWEAVMDSQTYGSYLVFRKLKQDVPLFHRKVSELASTLNISIELAEAQVVGRFKDGTPLAIFDSPRRVRTKADLEKVERFNNYQYRGKEARYEGYATDREGKKCPFHAHIRKVNPRNEQLKPDSSYTNDPELITQIVRRGIPYDQPGHGVGLLFLAFQKSLKAQFYRIQHGWANNPDFNPGNEGNTPELTAAGIDPLIGQKERQNRRNSDIPVQQWNKGWNTDEKVEFDFSGVVQFQGGEYFHVPTISYLKDLKTIDAPA